MSEREAGEAAEPEVEEVEPGVDEVEPGVDEVEPEVVDGELIPVAIEAHELTVASWTARPAVQAAAAAATGFVAGAATLALMRRYGLRRVARQVQTATGGFDPRRPRWPPMGDADATYIVHVRVLTPRPPR